MKEIPKPAFIGIIAVVVIIVGYFLYSSVFAGPGYSAADAQLNEDRVKIADANAQRNEAALQGGAPAAPAGEEAARSRNPGQ